MGRAADINRGRKWREAASLLATDAELGRLSQAVGFWRDQYEEARDECQAKAAEVERLKGGKGKAEAIAEAVAEAIARERTRVGLLAAESFEALCRNLKSDLPVSFQVEQHLDPVLCWLTNRIHEHKGL